MKLFLRGMINSALVGLVLGVGVAIWRHMAVTLADPYVAMFFCALIGAGVGAALYAAYRFFRWVYS